MRRWRDAGDKTEQVFVPLQNNTILYNRSHSGRTANGSKATDPFGYN